MVSAFEQSLSNMTTRLQQLTKSADEKVSSYRAEMEVTVVILAKVSKLCQLASHSRGFLFRL